MPGISSECRPRRSSCGEDIKAFWESSMIPGGAQSTATSWIARGGKKEGDAWQTLEIGIRSVYHSKPHPGGVHSPALWGYSLLRVHVGGRSGDSAVEERRARKRRWALKRIRVSSVVLGGEEMQS